MRTLVVFESMEGMRGDVAATKREREDAAERAEDPRACAFFCVSVGG